MSEQAELQPSASLQRVNRDSVYVRISDYLGDFRLNGWANRPDNQFFNNVRPGRKSLVMPFSFDIAKQYSDSLWNGAANHSTEWMGKMFMDNGAGAPIDNAYRQNVTAAYTNLVNNLIRPLDGAEQNEKALGNFLQEGQNQIFFTCAGEGTPFFADLELFTRQSGQINSFYAVRITDKTPHPDGYTLIANR